ncbi:MAG: cell division protein ZapA, partial [Candidatus Marinimicrobia bacterium]|nr:cell division protein ZapA [Candidatus Neomarinimicrobiota bacterium]
MSDQSQNIVRVEIYDNEYTVRAVANPDYIKEVAAYVDERMRETELNIP